jgi:phage terminase large subunit
VGVQVSDFSKRQPGEVRICEDLIRPNPKQRRFLDALFESIKFILYGGAAGGGKSYILRWGAIYFLVKAFALFGVRDVVVGLFCEDYPSLEKRHLAKIETEFPKWLGELKKDFKLGLHYRLRPEFGGGIIILANLDEASKYDSVEFAAVFVDELTKNKLIEGDDKNIFDQLRKRLRWPRKAHRWLTARPASGPSPSSRTSLAVRR